jgi:ABC-2 type transport system ATP-binding protein
MTSGPQIEIRNLVKAYDGFRAVDGLSLAAGAGEIVGLVGPNGAGKTTTLRCLCGIVPPTEGRITIAGHDLFIDSVAAKRELAFVPDEPHLFDHLTAWDFLQVTARLYGVTDGDARATELLSHFGLADKRLAFPSELSRGMKQKLMISAALLHRPRVMVLDEPLTGLDPRAMRHMKDTITTAARDGASVLVSSHMLRLVEEICHRVVVIHKGKAILDGTLDEIRSAVPGGSTDLEEVFLRATEDPVAPAAEPESR